MFELGFPCRLGLGLVWRVNRSLWERVIVTLTPETSGKFTLIPSPLLHRLINKSQLEARFGGLATDLSSFWPPKQPHNSIYSTEITVPLSDYSSYQEYYPMKSLSSSSVSEGGPSDLVATMDPENTDEAAETEEGPMGISPVRDMGLVVDLAREYYPSEACVRRRISIRTESRDMQWSCCCLSKREDTLCRCFAKEDGNRHCVLF